jgi:hypothetical protein
LKIFNLAFENYKKIALYAGLMILFSILIGVLFAAGLISYLGITAFYMMKPENLAENMSEFNKILIMVVSVIGICLFSPFPAGLIKMASSAQKMRNFMYRLSFLTTKRHTLRNCCCFAELVYLALPYLQQYI